MRKQIRYKHNLSNKHSSTFSLGELIPVNLLEVLPGDSLMAVSTALIRFIPMLAPQLTKINAHIVHYYVPSRLLWDSWEDFITGGESGTAAPTFPTINLGTVAKGSLADYFGIPTGVANTTVNALPFRAYAKIWNEYFCDKDINTDLVVSIASGVDTTTSTILKRVNWAKDDYTTAKPWPQRGTAVSLPLGVSAPLNINIGSPSVEPNGTGVAPTFTNAAETTTLKASNTTDDVRASATWSNNNPLNWADPKLRVKAGSITGTADLTTATSATIQQIRQAFALQKYMERQAMFGGKYSEFLAQLGIVSEDARLQRPEYLAGGVSPVQISEVLSTNDDATYKAGTLRGHGIGGVRTNKYMRFIPEHGYIMSLMYLRPESHYLDGLDKMWSRSVRTDFYDRDLASMGMQEVRNKEVYLAHSAPNGVHGYNWRYYDYMSKRNVIAGDFRDTVANFWHLARDFSSDTALNESFVTCDPGDRIFAASGVDNVRALVRNSIIARRIVIPGNKFVG